MRVIVELTGAARSLVGKKHIPYELPATGTYRDVIRLLAADYPELIGLLIDTDGETFLSSNLFAINGDLASPAMIMEENPHDGDLLLLLSVITGG